MAALNDDQKQFIVEALACFDSPAQVIDSVKQEFGIQVSPQQLQAYNPATKAGARMSQRLKSLFDATRERFRHEAGQIPIAHRAYRLRAMSRVLDRAEKMRNLPLILQVLEQAAKETGDVFTNSKKHELAGPNGGPIPMMPTTIELVAPASDQSED